MNSFMIALAGNSIFEITKRNRIIGLSRFIRKIRRNVNTTEGKKGGKTEFTPIAITYCILWFLAKKASSLLAKFWRSACVNADGPPV